MDNTIKTQTENYNSPKIFIATPCYVGQVHVKYMESMLGLQTALIKHGIGFDFYTIPFDSLIPRARNASVTRFLRSEKATHLFFIDADIQFNPESVLKMLKEDKDVIAGCYPKKALDFEAIKNNYTKTTSQLELIQSSVKYAFNFKHQKKHKMIRGVVEVLDAPTGFMMIKKSVIRKMIENYPNTEYKNDVAAYQVNKDDRFFDLFQSQVFDKRYLSEDYGFCRLWQNMNGTIYADLTVKLNHIGQFHFYGDPIMFLKNSEHLSLSKNERIESESDNSLEKKDMKDDILESKESALKSLLSNMSKKEIYFCLDLSSDDGREITEEIHQCNLDYKWNFMNVNSELALSNINDMYKEWDIKHVDFMKIENCEKSIINELFSEIHINCFKIKKTYVNKKIKMMIKTNNFKFHKSEEGYEYYKNKFQKA